MRSGPNLRQPWVALWLMLVVTMTACGERTSEVLARYKDRFADVRRSFRTIAETLPDPQSIKAPTPAVALTPAPVCCGDDRNTEIISYGELHAYAEPPSAAGSGERSVLVGGILLTALAWTGPNNPMSSDAMAGRDSEFAKKLDGALATRYLVIYRRLSGSGPTVDAAGKTFQGGEESYLGYIVDFPSREVKATLAFGARSSDTVRFSVGAGQDRADRAQAFASSDLSTNLKKSLQAELTRVTGVTFAW